VITQRDTHYMALALAEAREAAAAGEVPVGAVLVRPGQGGEADWVLARAHNQPITLTDPTAHAEMLALRAAAAALGNYRLEGCELYVTLEPCAMCAQALLHARLARVVYGAREPRTGADGSVVDVLRNPALNHQTTVVGGVQAEACAALMQTFFADRREQARREATPLRDDALRSPDAAFEPLWQAFPAWRDASRYTQRGAALDGLRLHWLDLQGASINVAAPVRMALHGPEGWWPEWSGWAIQSLKEGHHVLLPDLIGFGMSDKPKKTRWHTLARHADVLAEWLQGLEGHTTGWHLVVHPAQEALAQALLDRLPAGSASVELRMPEPHEALREDWRWMPYPDAGHQAAMKAWPSPG
jgi:tRNA(adenine34) deaminase